MRIPLVLTSVVLVAAGLLTLVTASCSDYGEKAEDELSEGGSAPPSGSVDSSAPPAGDGGDAGTGCGGPEKCGNDIDDNCNGDVDEGCDCDGGKEGTLRPCGQDGPGICTLGGQTCAAGTWSECTAVVAHAKEDSCDGKDENCNGEVDEGLTITCLYDGDHDGYPDPKEKKVVCPDPSPDAGARLGCPVDYLRESQLKGLDCNDGDPAIQPGAPEQCDATDWDCDGKPRNGCPSATETYADPVDSSVIGITVTTARCGTQVYATSTTTCPAGAGNGLTGFSGFPSGTFPGPTQLRIVCNDGLINEAAGAPLYSYSLVSNGSNTTGALTGAGRADDTAASASCDTGQWLVGLKVTRSCIVDRVSLICAPITYVNQGSKWAAKTGTTTTKNVLGNPSSLQPESVLQCPSGSVVTEITEWHTTGTATDSNYVSALKIGCRALGFTPQ